MDSNIHQSQLETLLIGEEMGRTMSLSEAYNESQVPKTSVSQNVSLSI